MKKILLLVLAVILAGVALAQSSAGDKPAAKSAAKSSGGDTTAAITKLERDWEAAMNKKDEAAVAKILADGWIGVNPDGSTDDKAKFLSEVKNGDYQSVKLQSINVKSFGSTAVATGKADDPKAGNAIYMDVFVRQGGGWKAVASQVAKAQ